MRIALDNEIDRLKKAQIHTQTMTFVRPAP
jgi:hypothetical protein